ncbi:MAG: undecaprenyldiphospho-muramoylpentapeptide beta-N-acetylglucosaminyltransferase [Actinomycetaceae bacterium]|nr:undecaprenyldiphospho-muramoylpentapeptide beta-N-acetylglucosaminyltransferase [Actinomycetaceae bacterium]
MTDCARNISYDNAADNVSTTPMSDMNFGVNGGVFDNSDTPVALLAGGGTAGHVNPLLATAKQLRQRGWLVHILGTSQGLESDLVPRAGFELHTIDKVAMPRRFTRELITVPMRLFRSVNQVRELIRRLHVDVVVGFGGYVSTPAYVAAHREKIPLVIHEQNARPGLANRLGARWAQHVALTFSSTDLTARHGQTSVIGLPLRDDIEQLARHRISDSHSTRVRAARFFDLHPQRPILLVTGGSLGAQQLNEAMVGALKEGIDPSTQIIHLTGKGKDVEVRKAGASMPNYRVFDYLNEMDKALACADLVVCRSGAGTVSELCALAIPAVYVPLPHGNGEQRYNAADVIEAGGAFLINNDAMDSTAVRKRILPLLEEETKLKKMSEAAARCGNIAAAQALADRVVECKGDRRS